MLRALICDVDGTITDSRRRVNTRAIHSLRTLIDGGTEVVLASGNTVCFMDALSRMIGTGGTIVAENGGVFRVGYQGKLNIFGNRKTCWQAFRFLESYFTQRGIQLELYSPDYRFSDVAFARSVDAGEVRDVLKAFPVRVLDTSYAIHIQSIGFTKGDALQRLAPELGLSPSDFLAIGDSMNDVEMIRAAGIGVAVGNAHPDAKKAADWVSEKEYGEGFVEALEKYFPDFGPGEIKK